MKKISLLITVLIIVLFVNSQELLTIREVFDFEIEDEFHYEGLNPDQPPNADRVTINDKYYSENEDTLFYLKYHDSYFTIIELDPEPHLEYTFYTETDTVFYTNLDSSISHYYQWVNYDTNFFSYYVYDTVLSLFCDSVINGFNYATNNFEPDVYSRDFGKGLGRVKAYMYSGSALPPGVQYHSELFYYQKNGIECGIPDLTTVDISEFNESKNEIGLYPNPANDYFQVNVNNSYPCLLQIYNPTGNLTISRLIDKSISIIDCRSYSPGIYIISFSSETDLQFRKLIIE